MVPANEVKPLASVCWESIINLKITRILNLSCVDQHLRQDPQPLLTLPLTPKHRLSSHWLSCFTIGLNRTSASSCTGCSCTSAVAALLPGPARRSSRPISFILGKLKAASLHVPGCHLSRPPAGAAMVDGCSNSLTPICSSRNS